VEKGRDVLVVVPLHLTLLTFSLFLTWVWVSLEIKSYQLSNKTEMTSTEQLTS
jgi:uncharacterized membrane protein